MTTPDANFVLVGVPSTNSFIVTKLDKTSLQLSV